jgi:hypothetical protein
MLAPIEEARDPCIKNVSQTLTAQRSMIAFVKSSRAPSAEEKQMSTDK